VASIVQVYRGVRNNGSLAKILERRGERLWPGFLADCHDPTLSGMSSWTFYLLQENNEKLSVPVQFTLFLNFIVDAPSLSLSAIPGPG